MKTAKEIEKLATKNYRSNGSGGGQYSEGLQEGLVRGFIDGYKKCQEDADKEIEISAIQFSEWFNDNGWIRRPFEEENGVYLYDDHTEEHWSNLYVNPKTINELFDIYKSQKI